MTYFLNGPLNHEISLIFSKIELVTIKWVYIIDAIFTEKNVSSSFQKHLAKGLTKGRLGLYWRKEVTKKRGIIEEKSLKW